MALSTDPDKRARQLANLEAGRRRAAENLLGDSAARPRRAARSSAESSADDVHTYPPADPEEPAPDAGPDAAAPPSAHPEPDASRRAGGFLDGLRAGFAD
jgi:hypothetical protein